MTTAAAGWKAPLRFLEETEAPKSDYDTHCNACFMGMYGLKFHTPILFGKPFMGLLSSHTIISKKSYKRHRNILLYGHDYVNILSKPSMFF